MGRAGHSPLVVVVLLLASLPLPSTQGDSPAERAQGAELPLRFVWVEGSLHLVVWLSPLGGSEGMVVELVDAAGNRSFDPPLRVVAAAPAIPTAVAAGLPVNATLSGWYRQWRVAVDPSDPTFTPLTDLDDLPQFLTRACVRGPLTDTGSSRVLFPLPAGTSVPQGEAVRTAEVYLGGAKLPALLSDVDEGVLAAGNVTTQAGQWPLLQALTPIGQAPVLLPPHDVVDPLPGPNERTPFHRLITIPDSGSDLPTALSTSAQARLAQQAAGGGALEGLVATLTLQRLAPLPTLQPAPPSDIGGVWAWSAHGQQVLSLRLGTTSATPTEVFSLIPRGAAVGAAPLAGTEPILDALPTAVGAGEGDPGSQLLRTVEVLVPGDQLDLAPMVRSVAQLDALGWERRSTALVQLRPALPLGSEVTLPADAPPSVSAPSLLRGWWQGHPLTLLDLGVAGVPGIAAGIDGPSWPTLPALRFATTLQWANIPVIPSAPRVGGAEDRYLPLCSGPEVVGLAATYVPQQADDAADVVALLADPTTMARDRTAIFGCPVLADRRVAPPTTHLHLRFLAADTRLPLLGQGGIGPAASQASNGSLEAIVNGTVVTVRYVPQDQRYGPLEQNVSIDLTVDPFLGDLLVARDPSSVPVVVPFGPITDARDMPLEGVEVTLFGPDNGTAVRRTDAQGIARINVTRAWTSDSVGYRLRGDGLQDLSGAMTLTAEGGLSGTIPPMRSASQAEPLDVRSLVVGASLLVLSAVIIVVLLRDRAQESHAAVRRDTTRDGDLSDDE